MTGIQNFLKAPLSFLIVFFLVFSHQLVFAKVYKCKGVDGKIEYRQSACPVNSEENTMDHLNYKKPKGASNNNPVEKLIMSREKRDDDVCITDACVEKFNREYKAEHPERCTDRRKILARYEAKYRTDMAAGKLTGERKKQADTMMEYQRERLKDYCL